MFHLGRQWPNTACRVFPKSWNCDDHQLWSYRRCEVFIEFILPVWNRNSSMFDICGK
jgi:hypothetical protein